MRIIKRQFSEYGVHIWKNLDLENKINAYPYQGGSILFKLCFNSTTLRNIDLFKALSLIKSYGYEGVELTINDTHLHPLKHRPKRVEEVKTYCEDNGINIVCLAAGGPNVLGDEPYEPSLINPNPAKRDLRLDFIKKSMELANDLNSPVLNINSGKLQQNVSAEEAHDHLFDGIQKLLAHGGDLILVMEPEPDFFVGTTDKAVDFLKEINSANLQLNLDIGHVFCSEDHCYDHIQKALPYSRHIHIEDIRNGVHHHEIPGEGDIDFRRIIRLIKQSGYEHFVSVELHHHDAVWERALKESREYLQRLI